MQSLSTSEASAASLPSLFEKAKEDPIVVSSSDGNLGAIVSMEDFEIVRRVRAERVFDAMEAFGKTLRDSAGEQGIPIEDLEKMLDRHGS